MSRRSLLMLAVLLAGALALRVAAVAFDAGAAPQIDAADYDRHARSIAAGDGYPPTLFAAPGSPTAVRPPAYPYLLGAVYRVTGGGFDAGRLAGAVLGTLLVVLLFALAELAWGRRTAWMAAGLAAVFPPLVFLNSSLVSEALFLPLEVAALAAVLVARRAPRPLPWAALAGVLCGVATLTRVVGLLLVVVAAAGVWAARRPAGRRALAAPAVVAGCAALVVAPWTVRNAIEFDSFVPVATQEGINLSGSYNAVADERPRGAFVPPSAVPDNRPLFGEPSLDEADVNRVLTRRGATYALEHPERVGEVTWWSLLRMFDVAGDPTVTRISYVESGVPTGLRRLTSAAIQVAAVLALLGIAALALRRGPPRGPRFVWLAPALLLATTAPVLGTPRYRAPLDPFIVVLCAIAAVALTGRLRRRGPAARA